ncbi:hypothetical protein E8D89_10105, partial [Escherichia coli]|nr:hypothetical protein [Escherichia coli]
KKTAPDGAVSGMPAIRETGPGKNLQAITVSTNSHATRRPDKVFTPHPAVVLGWAYKMHVLGSHHYLLLRRSSATSTIISSWPPTIRRLPSSTRISTALKP